MINEQGIIDFLREKFPLKYGIGDDAAILPFNSKQSYVITKDMIVEDVHFRKRYYNIADIANKAVIINLSDIAAMGAKPKYMLLGLAIPECYSSSVKEFLHNISMTAKKFGIKIIGGDSVRSTDKICISVTLIGVMQTKHIKCRNKAKIGDVVCVAGDLGYAHLGLHTLENNVDGYEIFKKHCLKPIARSNEGIWLAKQTSVHSMMDLSDGLYTDLNKLCKSSKVSSVIELSNLNFMQNAKDYRKFTNACENLNLNPTEVQLAGGEDYGLLLTIKESAYNRIAQEFKKKFKYELKKIGMITENHEELNHHNRVKLLMNGQNTELVITPFFEH